MRTRIAMLALIGASLSAPTSQALAESAVAFSDLSLRFDTATTMPLPGSNLVVELTIANDGDFGAEEAIVSIPIPDGLTLLSADTTTGSYDLGTGQWTTTAIDSFGSNLLTLNLVVDVDAPATIVLIADLVSFSSSFGAYDYDSTPGNANPCEDDYAALKLTIAGVPQPDAGNGQPDAGTVCPGPVAPADAGPGGSNSGDAGELDAGPGDSSGSGGGCTITGPRATSWQLLLLGICALALRRRRRNSL